MAEHAELEYATADGNDLPAHETGYAQFVEFTIVSTNCLVNLLLGLTVGGVIGHWLPAAAVIIASVIAAVISLWTGSRIPGVVMLAVAALVLLLNAY
jgi:hypothetical protein